MAAALAPSISFLLNTDQVIWGIAGISPISPFRPGPGHGLHPMVIWVQSAHDWPHVVTVCVLGWDCLRSSGSAGMAVKAEDVAARLLAELPQALRSGQLVTYFQPEVELSFRVFEGTEMSPDAVLPA